MTKPRVFPAFLACATVLAYLPALGAGFVWDDDTTLTRNALMGSAEGLRRLWFSTDAPDYWPVSSTSLWLEWRIWGDHPAGYHAVNLALHIGCALLAWALLRRLKVPGAEWAALLFALHPAGVEAVAWIAQRKTVLATAFGLLSAVLFFDRRPWINAGLSLAAFVLALLSKGSIAFLPAVLLALLLRNGKPGRSELPRLAPFFAAAAAFAAIDIWFQHHAGVGAIRRLTAVQRLLAAGAVPWFYLAKATLPADLSFVYPAWRVDPAAAAWWLPAAAIAAAAAMLRAFRSRPWARAAALSSGCFCLALVPVLGLTDVYFMKYAPVADHYQYAALIALAAAAGAAIARLGAAGSAAGALAAAGFGMLTFVRCGSYGDSGRLFGDAARLNPGSAMVQANLGAALAAQGRLEEARGRFDRALRLDPADAEALDGDGGVSALEGRWNEAAGEFRGAIRLRPDYAEAHCNLGIALARLGDAGGAIAEYRRAIAQEPNYADAHNDLGIALAGLGRFDEAAEEFRRTVAILDPEGLGSAEAAGPRANLATALRQAAARRISIDRPAARK